MSSLDDQHQALVSGNALILLDRDVIEVAGPDAAKFLQGQLSQNIAAIETGGGARTFLLEPSGKVTAWMVITRSGDESFLLDVEASFGDLVIERLCRFKLRTKAEVEKVDGRRVALRLPRTGQATGEATGEVEPSDLTFSHALAGLDYYISRDPEFSIDGLVPSHSDAYEPWRIEAGVPKLGAELVPGKTIPAESGDWVIKSSVSFTKGCYTGQELVARIDSRGGNVPRHLRSLVIEGDRDRVPPPGSDVIIDGKSVGSVTSSAWSPSRKAPVALSFIGRAIEPSTAASLRWEHDGTVVAVPARIAVAGLGRF